MRAVRTRHRSPAALCVASSATASPSVSATGSATVSQTPSTSPTRSATPTRSPTATATVSRSATQTPSAAHAAVFPNPARAGETVCFTGLPPGARVRIYNLRGERGSSDLVADAAGVARWRPGPSRARGVYAYRAAGPGFSTRAGAVCVVGS